MAHLDPRASEEDVRQLFSAHGAVMHVRIIQDRDTGQSRGYGFVTMGTPGMAQVGWSCSCPIRSMHTTIPVKGTCANKKTPAAECSLVSPCESAVQLLDASLAMLAVSRTSMEHVLCRIRQTD